MTKILNMDSNTLFDLTSAIAACAWALMIFTPRWKYTQRAIQTIAIPGVLSVFYLGIVITHFSTGLPDFSSLREIRVLFSNDYMLLPGWIHYLSFDLVIGSWILTKSQAQGFSHWLVAPVLLLTFMMGPVGLLAFFILYYLKIREWPLITN